MTMLMQTTSWYETVQVHTVYEFAICTSPIIYVVPPPKKKILSNLSSFISPGYYSRPKRNWRQCLCELLWAKEDLLLEMCKLQLRRERFGYSFTVKSNYQPTSSNLVLGNELFSIFLLQFYVRWDLEQVSETSFDIPRPFFIFRVRFDFLNATILWLETDFHG